jgi:hypothetical protein
VNGLRLAAGLAAILALGLSGCAGYRLGPTNATRAGEKSIAVAPFGNRTLEPRLADPTTAALRKELQRDGTFRLASAPDGDVLVAVELTHYQRAEQSFIPTDVTTARDYRLVLTAHVVARERFSGQVLLDREVSGTALMRVGRDLPSAERQALPLLAADLARQITSLLVDGAW